MRAAVYYGQKDVRVEDVPEPVLRPGTVMVEVDWCGICGTDLHEFVAGPIFIPKPGEPHVLTGETLPVIIGHEFGGRVLDVAGDVKGVHVGDRVCIEPTMRCGTCPECRTGRFELCRKLGFHGLSGGGGGFSERTVVPAYMIHAVPDEVTDEMAALVEPLAVGFHAVRTSGLRPGDTAFVTGAGPIGMATLVSLRAAGARFVVVSEMAAARQEIARRHGAIVVDPAHDDVADVIAKLTDGLGVDFAFDTAGAPTSLETATAVTHPAGTVVNIAIWERPIELQPNTLVLSERNLTGSICYSGQDFPTVLRMLADGRLAVDDFVTSRIDLADIVTNGFEELLEHRDRHVKILVRPGTK